jgi:hypothetical protein
MYNPKPIEEQLTLDMNQLKLQYKKIKQRQCQARVIIQTASEQYRAKTSSSSTSSLKASSKGVVKLPTINPLPIVYDTPAVVNHLLLKTTDLKRNYLTTNVQYDPNTSSLMPTVDVNNNNNNNDDGVDDIYDKNRQKLINETKVVKENANKVVKEEKTQLYYSSEDDDDDDDEDDVLKDDEDYSFYKNDNFNKSIHYKQQQQQQQQQNQLKLESLTLNELVDIGKNNKDVSLSSSASISPSINNKEEKESVQRNDSVVSSNRDSLKRIKSTDSTSTVDSNQQHRHNKGISSVLINHLVEEEEKQKPPPNPFPMRQLNRNIRNNGMRLGLYK